MSEKGCIDSLFACRKQEEKYYFQVLLNWEMGKEIIYNAVFYLPAATKRVFCICYLTDGD